MTSSATSAEGAGPEASAATAAASGRSGDIETITLVGVAHGTSHFFHMLLPPLFPVFISEFGFSYAELGLLVSTFFIISGIGQALSGFVVDRIGARPVLFFALGCFLAAALSASSAQGYSGLVLTAVLAGMGNAPFHPADFTILNQRVSQARLGHAFSVHGISGSVGWALAPVVLVGLTQWTGSWRMALAASAVWVLLVMLLLLWRGRAIGPVAAGLQAAPGQASSAPAGSGSGSGTAASMPEHPMAFLKLPSVWLCFSFFFWSTCSLTGVQSFASPALQRLHELPLGITSLVVTGYMTCSALGMVAGGFLVKRAERLEHLISLCLGAGAVLLLLVGSGVLPGLLAAVLVALAGGAVGMGGPSRDMLIRKAAPAGATGRVYGTVYSGLDIGFAIAAPIFGYLMDHGGAGSVFTGAGLALLLGIVSASLVGRGVWRRAQAMRNTTATG